MWSTTRNVFLCIGAILTVLVYTLQFKKACENNTPFQCLMETWRWAGQGALTAREVASVPPKQDTPAPIKQEKPPPPKETASLPPPPTQQQGVVQTSREVTTAPKEDRRLVVINSGDVILDNFYASNCKAKHWGRDRLGEATIGAGQRKMFDLEDGLG